MMTMKLKPVTIFLSKKSQSSRAQVFKSILSPRKKIKDAFGERRKPEYLEKNLQGQILLRSRFLDVTFGGALRDIQ